MKLDELYPDFKIDTAREQQRLLHADVIVLQFTIFWYSAPSLLHRWMEETFLHSFSHGRTGDKLKGKKLVLSVTTGAPPSAYTHNSAMGCELNELLTAFKATCRLCQMQYCGCVSTGGVSYLNRTDPEKIKEQNIISQEHAQRLVNLIEQL